MKWRRVWMVVPAVLLVLAGCKDTGRENPVPEVTTLIYAKISANGGEREPVDTFNRTHTDVQIEIRDYSDENGCQRLLTELAAGRFPDIIDLGGDLSAGGCRLPYRMLAESGFLENLWPYIENDPDLGREGVVEAPLKAAEVDGGLYTIFSEVQIDTLAGAASLVGDRTSWSLDELRDAFAVMPEGSTVVEYTYTRGQMFACIFGMNVDRYVDWKSGTCSFDSEAFRSDLEFINSFPDKTGGESSWRETEAEITKRKLNGLQMLSRICIVRPADMQYIDAFYGQGGRAVPVGYPVGDGSVGSSFQIQGSSVLAMSSACQNKDAAWEFMRRLLLRKPLFQSVDILRKTEASPTSKAVNIPINRADYDVLIQADSSRDLKYPSRKMALFAGPTLELRPATEEEVQRYEDFLNSVEKIYLFDNEVYQIVEEAAGAYFAEDKTLDETVDLIQRRATLYVNENT